jgi:hypothetical protein
MRRLIGSYRVVLRIGCLGLSFLLVVFTSITFVHLPLNWAVASSTPAKNFAISEESHTTTVSAENQVVGAEANALNVYPTSTAQEPSLVAAFGSQGLWFYNNGTWTLLSSHTPNLMVRYGYSLVANFPGYGLYQYGGNTWTQLSPNSSVENLLGVSDKVYVDYGMFGLWKYSGGKWTQIAGTSPDKMVANGNNLVATFPGSGLYQYNGTAFTQLSSASSVDSMIAISGKVYVSFVSLGLWKYDGGWSQLTTASTNCLASYGGKLVGNFGGYGLYETNGNPWVRLTATDTVQNLVGVGSNLYADYGSQGLHRYSNAWSQVSGLDPNYLGLHGEKLVVNFPGYGLYDYDGSSWTMLANNAGATDMVSVDFALVCNTGWGNCDGDPGNGCETNLNSFYNCGSCGHFCSPGDYCSAGKCECSTCCNSGVCKCCLPPF